MCSKVVSLIQNRVVDQKKIFIFVYFREKTVTSYIFYSSLIWQTITRVEVHLARMVLRVLTPGWTISNVVVSQGILANSVKMVGLNHNELSIYFLIPLDSFFKWLQIVHSLSEIFKNNLRRLYLSIPYRLRRFKGRL